MKTILSVLILGLSFSAYAQEQDNLEVRTVVQKQEQVVNDNGEEENRLVAVESVVPGERVFYTITFTNVGEEPADNVIITNPIATELSYVDGSAFGPGMDVEFSVDGGASFAKALELTVVEDGETRAAGPDDFTHIRWVMQGELNTGSQGTARFAAILN
jgi:uncharacterized repeat protein (TIGR01451 family)